MGTPTYQLQDYPAVSAAVLMLLATLVVVLHHEGFATLVGMWQYSNYGHGYLIPLLSVYILIRDREALKTVGWNGSYLGLAVLAGAVVLWLIGRSASIQAVEHVALVTMIVSCCWSVAGDRVMFAAWFPLLYLFLAVPIGEELVPLLQTITADVATFALNLFGISAFRDGWSIALPGGDFEVAKACSGFRYLNAGVAMAVFISYLVLTSAWLRVAYVALIAALFIVVNGVRAFLVMWIASATDMRYMAGEDHVWFGYVLFLGIAVFAYWLATRISETTNRQPQLQAG